MSRSQHNAGLSPAPSTNRGEVQLRALLAPKVARFTMASSRRHEPAARCFHDPVDRREDATLEAWYVADPRQ